MAVYANYRELGLIAIANASGLLCTDVQLHSVTLNALADPIPPCNTVIHNKPGIPTRSQRRVNEKQFRNQLKRKSR